MSSPIYPSKAVLLALLAACNAASDRPPAGQQRGQEAGATGTGEYRPPRDLSQLDPCALLSPSAIPPRFGKVIEGPTLTRDPNGRPTCSYVLSPNTGLIVELFEARWYDLNRGMWDRDKVQDVSGIGQKGYVVSLKPPADPYLVAAKNDIAVKVTTRNLELARNAALMVLAKL